MASSEPKKRGDVIEGYKILSELGRGAASVIFVVQDMKSKQVWALKQVERGDAKDSRFLDQAESEYRIAQNLDHPSIRKIVKMFKKGTLLTTKELYLVMELVDGVSVDRAPPEKFDQAVDIFRQVAEAMHHMHTRGYVHADMKPNNIVIADGGIAKIIDLGQGCKIGTIKPRIQGTPDYIAPEQVHRRPITPKTDIYNLGATMYWVLTRQHIPTALPKGDSLVNSLDDSRIQKPKPTIELNPRIHPKLSELIMACVEVDADKRPESMALVADRLSLILGILRARAEDVVRSMDQSEPA
ncbi:serine/threonine-protein kinase [Nodularia spumigena]|uniref:serine/threonine-protein kinase n=1 Tax=Nodularia spumigena TaxID=70799 RepID=UPI002B1EE658|nr:serine/threonine-protein kinase [Nodularia spumigena]MEA5557624.1 serine/threonine-protein kinase [Nodularia spumigena CH309]